MIRTIEELNEIDFKSIQEDEFWNKGDCKELLIHKVHVYPAKFPSLIAQKSFAYAEQQGVSIKRVCDVFCGCGTVAVEARRKGYDFWGCDLNPVAVLLARVKTNRYSQREVKRLKRIIVADVSNAERINCYEQAHERLKHWYSKSQYNSLYVLKAIIEKTEMKSKYKDLFLCIFSSILKSTSNWLTKSIKPQVDPNKEEKDVLQTFIKQTDVFIEAIAQEDYQRAQIKIELVNAMEISKKNYVDLLITSPPYVTSYEYADLHQLSTLWLGYTEDYKELRRDSIGSLYETTGIEHESQGTALKIVESFPQSSKRKSVARYYSQMNIVIQRCFQILRPNGMCVFVIGDTEYKDVCIENARCLAESMLNCGFIIERLTKRKIENKFLPSHRGKDGKFSSDKTDRQIYSQEYIIIGRKK